MNVIRNPEYLTKRDSAFAQQLHNKLWENIAARESRIYTFLGLYGAGLGFLFSKGGKVGLAGCFLVLLISSWAARIIATADWWSVRNRLMIERIERLFPGVSQTVIPQSYQAIGYRPESMNMYSLAVVAVAALAVHLSVLLTFVTATKGPSPWQVVGLMALALFLFWAADHIGERRAESIWNYWALVRGYDVQDQAVQDHTPEYIEARRAEVSGQEAKDDHRFGNITQPFWYVLVALGATGAAIAVDGLLTSSGARVWTLGSGLVLLWRGLMVFRQYCGRRSVALKADKRREGEKLRPMRRTKFWVVWSATALGLLLVSLGTQDSFFVLESWMPNKRPDAQRLLSGSPHDRDDGKPPLDAAPPPANPSPAPGPNPRAADGGRPPPAGPDASAREMGEQ